MIVILATSRMYSLTKEGGEITNENADSLEEIFGILAEEGSDWFHGFFTFLYDVISPPVEKVEDPESETAEEEGDADEKEVKTAAPKKETLKKEDKKKAENIVEVPVPKTEKTKDQSPGEVASKKNRTKEHPTRELGRKLKSALKEQLRMIHEKIEAQKIAEMALAEVRSILDKEEEERQLVNALELKRQEGAQKAQEMLEAQLREEREQEEKREAERKAQEQAGKERLEKAHLEQREREGS
ncbi:unnamed protein product [Oncorhynchus mykiss]|uniref:Uncharacterized protein n=1 Tax=Oncorhynchus mykiss TaxID=8022 RepID=A0A060WDW1_ONCMY|nr:unnamed protein product [Oncorhynchus mykiss]